MWAKKKYQGVIDQERTASGTKYISRLQNESIQLTVMDQEDHLIMYEGSRGREIISESSQFSMEGPWMYLLHPPLIPITSPASTALH